MDEILQDPGCVMFFAMSITLVVGMAIGWYTGRSAERQAAVRSGSAEWKANDRGSPIFRYTPQKETK